MLNLPELNSRAIREVNSLENQELEDLMIAFPMRDIVSVRLFDPTIYVSF